MRKYLPFLVAGVVGLAAAVLLFTLGLQDGAKTGKHGKDHGAASAPADGANADDPSGEGGPAADATGPRPPAPPPGTIRPQNKAELEQAARFDRTFNQHFDRVAAYWTRAAQIVGKSDPALAEECGRMNRYLRDQSNSNEIDVATIVQNEKDLVTKIRAANSDKELGYVLDYIRDSADVTVQGGDVSAVRKPSEREAEDAKAGKK